MGLDMNPLGKPKPGCKDEFAAVWHRIQIATGNRPDPEMENAGWVKRLLSQGQTEDPGPLIARLQDLMIPPFEAMGAPVVGRDPAADSWFRKAFAAGNIAGHDDVETALAAARGYRALEALPDCAGFPVYTNAGAYEGVDRTSFRGSFLELCVPVIGEELLARAWDPMLAEELAAWAAALRRRVDAFAASHRVNHALGDKHYQWQDETAPDAQAHIVDQAARWAAFWSDRGHGNDPFF